jgi:UDP-glucose:(heptosyl)LPS alpha-1,3-glucosyltransferase
MRIAIVVERFEAGRGGVENVAWRAAHGLADAGDEVHVVARRASPAPAVRVHPIAVPASWQPLRVLAFSRAAARAAPRGSFDIVYSLCRTVHQDVYRAGAGSHADYLERRHPGPGGRFRRLSPRHAALLSLERRAFRDTTQLVVCNSEMVRSEIERRYGVEPRRTAIVRNGVDLERFHPRRREREGARRRRELGAGSEPVWLFAGSGFARKGLDTALRALARAEPGDAWLWVAGGDRDVRWRRLAQSLGVDSRVRFLGFRDDLPALYAAADALLLPTRYDAFANVCLEAAAAGMPVVTSAANGAAELLADAGRCLQDPEDVAGFAAALAELTDPQTRRRLGATARRIAGEYGWDAHLRALRELFRRVSR